MVLCATISTGGRENRRLSSISATVALCRRSCRRLPAPRCKNSIGIFWVRNLCQAEYLLLIAREMSGPLPVAQIPVRSFYCQCSHIPCIRAEFAQRPAGDFAWVLFAGKQTGG